MASDAAIQTRIREEFQTILEHPDSSSYPKVFKLTFKISGKTFTTVLKINCGLAYNNKAKYFSIYTNGHADKFCIEIGIAIPVPNKNGSFNALETYQQEGYAKFESIIRANSPSLKCFEPTLVSNRNNPDPAARYTATDVLQILKTKLQLLIPSPIPIPIELEDVATIQNVRMTPFNILRGKDPFYKKYGYVYNLQPLMEHLPAVQWGSIKNDLYFVKQLKNKSTVILKFSEVIPSITGKEYADTDLVVDIMKDISFADESKLNTDTIKKYEPHLLDSMFGHYHLSSNILAAILKTIHEDKLLWNYATLDPTSVEWQRTSERLQITGFEPVAKGGRRRKTRKRKTKRRGKN
jgi:hypothetical protein